MSVFFYENFKLACKDRGTTITGALKAIKKSTASTGAWQSGSYPQLDVCMMLADYLNVSLDYLVFRNHDTPATPEKPRDEIALELFQSLPEESQMQALEYLKALHTITHDKKKPGRPKKIKNPA